MGGFKWQERREGITTITSQQGLVKTAAVESVSDHLPAGMHNFLKAETLQKGSSSQHCNKGTATALFVLLECSSVAAPQQLTLSPIKGGNMALTSARPQPRQGREKSLSQQLR